MSHPKAQCVLINYTCSFLKCSGGLHLQVALATHLYSYKIALVDNTCREAEISILTGQVEPSPWLRSQETDYYIERMHGLLQSMQ